MRRTSQGVSWRWQRWKRTLGCGLRGVAVNRALEPEAELESTIRHVIQLFFKFGMKPAPSHGQESSQRKFRSKTVDIRDYRQQRAAEITCSLWEINCIRNITSNVAKTLKIGFQLRGTQAVNIYSESISFTGVGGMEWFSLATATVGMVPFSPFRGVKRSGNAGIYSHPPGMERRWDGGPHSATLLLYIDAIGLWYL